MLGTMGRSSYLKRHRVPRSEMTVTKEFAHTKDIDQWRIYSLLGGDQSGKFSRDFLREGDTISKATN